MIRDRLPIADATARSAAETVIFTSTTGPTTAGIVGASSASTAAHDPIALPAVAAASVPESATTTLDYTMAHQNSDSLTTDVYRPEHAALALWGGTSTAPSLQAVQVLREPTLDNHVGVLDSVGSNRLVAACTVAKSEQVTARHSSKTSVAGQKARLLNELLAA